MTHIEIKGELIDVDIRDELEQYSWSNARWQEDKLIASSPFRTDNAPSFWVNIDGEYAGLFGDSGYENEYYGAGNLPKLLAYLNDCSYEEMCDYLLEKYSPIKADGTIELKAKPTLERYTQRTKVIPKEVYSDKKVDKEYLKSRGIVDKVVALNNVFDNGQSVGIVWRNLNHEVCAIKYRSKTNKVFWYEDGGTPLSRLLFALNYKDKFKTSTAIICEAEIDAMTWQSIGQFAIAVGGARFNEYQKDLILMSGITTIILAGDNDSKGMDFNKQVYKLLNGLVDLKIINYDDLHGYKDVNDLGVDKLKEVGFVDVKPFQISL